MLSARCRQILESPDAPATVVFIILTDCFGFDEEKNANILVWDPGTIQEEATALLGKPLNDRCFNRVMAAIEIVSNDGFYKDLPTFLRLCHALFAGILVIEEFIPANAVEVSWGITEALILWPPDQHDEAPFSDQITGYIAEVLKNEGILKPPDVLRLGGGHDLLQKVHMGFSDDPAMFNAIYDVEESRTSEINQTVKERLIQIMDLLDQLPLNVGKAENAIKQMFSALGRERQSSQEMKPNV
jgi:hypothetical protein